MEWSLSTLITELSKSFLPAQWYADSNVITDYEKLIMMAAGYKSIKEYIDAFTVNKERFLCFFDKNFKDCTTETEGTSVTLSTIHSAKGLEWKHVFIIGMNDQNFPGIKKYDNQNPSKHEVYLNKKRKELFVALTRTAETLSISYPELVEGQDQTPSMLLTGLTVKKS
jgi:DNA helicase-2/ATP-dependent DNA helicase PcrA